MSTSTLRTSILLVGLAAALGGLIWDRDSLGVMHTITPKASPPQPTRILIVLDTVRADYTSLCGFEQPTTPTLEALAARAGAQSTCRAYTPGAWTMPSHASFFTGVPVLEHGAHFLPGEKLEPVQLSARGLDDRLETMAERLQAEGYQTLSVSGNPVLGLEGGLARGFDHLQIAEHFGDMEGKSLIEALSWGLLELDRDRPLFLFLNIADAHTPLERIPEDHPWLAPRARSTQDGSVYWHGDAEARSDYLADMKPLYTWGVQRADQTLAASIALLEERGWMDERSRVLITSDHGESLGEHELVGHGRHLREANNRVFLIAIDEALPKLPEPINAMEVHPLTLEGALAGFPVESVALPSIEISDPAGRTAARWAARWDGWSKDLWREPDYLARYDLSADPGELAPQPVDIEVFGDTPDRLLAVVPVEGGDDPLQQKLQALGYVE